jgi:hypothetical protein
MALSQVWSNVAAAESKAKVCSNLILYGRYLPCGQVKGSLCKTGAKCGKCDWMPEILYPQPNVFLKIGRVYPINILCVVTGPPNEGEVNTTWA